MASRSQIDRITRWVEQIALHVQPPEIAYVPIYGGESQQDAISAYQQELGAEQRPPQVVFNKARPGDTRQACIESGMHGMYRLSPSAIQKILARIDGKTRGIPMVCNSDR